MRIFVEGNVDKIVVNYILMAARIPNDEYSIMECGGKENVLRKAKQAGNDDIFLVDSDTLNIAEARKRIRDLGIDSEKVFFAIPSIESWLFADDKTLSNSRYLNENQISMLNRMSLTDEVPYPKAILNYLGIRKDNIVNCDFLSEIDIYYACTRSNSLRVFLTDMFKKIQIESEFEDNVLSRSINRDVYVNLLNEIIPSKAVIYRTGDGNEYSAERMILAIERGEDIGKRYCANLLRAARDFLKIEAELEEEE